MVDKIRAVYGRKWVGLGIDIALVGAIIFAISWWQTRDHISSGEVAPEFALQVLANASEDAPMRQTSTALQGKETVLYFWAPWCTVCEAQSSIISTLYDEDGEEINVRSIALGYEDVASVQRFVDEHEATYPVLLGTPGMTAQWKIDAFPTVYLLDAEGRIASSTQGLTTRQGILARLKVLAQSPSSQPGR